LSASAYLRRCEGFEEFYVPGTEPTLQGSIRAAFDRVSTATVEAFKIPMADLNSPGPAFALKKFETVVGETFEEIAQTSKRTARKTKSVFVVPKADE
jgi:hypothetical protein